MNEFITQCGCGEYRVIFNTDSVDNYHAVEDFCRKIIGHGKPEPKTQSINWISVKDRLPEIRQLVLVYTPDLNTVWEVYLQEDGKWRFKAPGYLGYDPAWCGQITHWMPLPEPPKEVQDVPVPMD